MSNYIMDLRKIVGHRTLIQCAASIICVNEKDQLLLGRRTDNHLWGYSGGTVEVDERIEDCARRELFEEMGVHAGECVGYILTFTNGKFVYVSGDTSTSPQMPLLAEKEIDHAFFCCRVCAE